MTALPSASAESAESRSRPKTPVSILNLPDSGGPYGRMKPGILEVARASNARLVPFLVTAAPALTLGKKLQHVIPLPACRLDVRRAPPLPGNATVEDCQRALDGLA